MRSPVRTDSVRLPAAGGDGTNPPCVCVVGRLGGGRSDRSTTQGDVLAGYFRAAGYDAIAASGLAGRAACLADIAIAVLRTRRRAGLLLVQTYSGSSFITADLATALGKRLGLPLVLHLHGGNLPDFMERHPGWSRRVLSRAAAMVAPSRYLVAAMERHGFAAQVIPNVIDLPADGFRARRVLAPKLFWMRSFHEIYNPLMALHAFARVRAAVPTATLVMAGPDKGLQAAARREAGRLGLADAVRFPGFLDGNAKLREGEQADIFLTTNRIDNTPVSVLEACALGLPVVATAVGGVPDLLQHEQTALLAPDGDDEAMAAAVLRLLGDSSLAERLSVNGRRLAEPSLWPNVRPLWEQLFSTLPAPRFRSRAARHAAP